ncbi:MAG: alpha-L-fucosidase, partial [Candidatus Latescibacteria bacterium]|nr:alpha-L-fucosidase [Candidatus Latescibacterota bacterium]
AQNGNFLLNVGPKPDGSFPDESLDRLSAIGKWMRTNGEAIYGAGSTDVVAPAMGWSTSIGDSVYLLVQRWPGTTLPFAWCGSRVSDATVLATGQEARIEQDGDRVWLHELPESAPDPDLSVIRLKFDGTPKGSDPPYR